MKKKLPNFLKFNISEWITIVCVVSMLGGFLFNRVMLSLGMILLFVHALNPRKIKENWNAFKSNRFALFCMLFFLAFFISGLWSNDKASWMHDAQVKLPFLILPFAMLGAAFKGKKMMKTIIYLVLASLWIGVLYSLIKTWNDPARFLAGGHIVGPVDKDYLRFTLSLVLGVNLSLYLLFKKKADLLNVEKLILGFSIALFAAYIHMQASKLGLAAYYVLSFIFVFFYFLPKNGILKTFGLVLIIGITHSMLFQFPTFKKQINRVHLALDKEEWVEKKDNEISSSFISRSNSYKAGFNIIKKHPLLGVGSGDLHAEMGKEYEKNFPMVTFNIIPHNQFIFTMVAVGIPLSFTLLLMFFYPMFKNSGFFEITSLAVMLCGFMVESMVQVQFGVFLYLFFTLFWIVTKPPISKPLATPTS